MMRQLREAGSPARHVTDSGAHSRGGQRLLFALAALVAGLGLALVQAASAPAATRTVYDSGWESPLPQGNDLAGVSCPTVTACKAVGGSFDFKETVLSCNGADWSADRFGNGTGLTSVSCATATMCKAVGAIDDVRWPLFPFLLNYAVPRRRPWHRARVVHRNAAPDGQHRWTLPPPGVCRSSNAADASASCASAVAPASHARSYSAAPRPASARSSVSLLHARSVRPSGASDSERMRAAVARRLTA